MLKNLTIILLALLLTGCWFNPIKPTLPTRTPLPTLTPTVETLPTSTPAPTKTPPSTSTPLATATSTPLATPLPEPTLTPTYVIYVIIEAPPILQIIRGGDFYTTKPGDCLWCIAEQTYGYGWLWPLIFEANFEPTDNPHLLHPGKRLWLPGLEME